MSEQSLSSLRRDEQVRVAALQLAVQYASGRDGRDSEVIITVAKKFERYIAPKVRIENS